MKNIWEQEVDDLAKLPTATKTLRRILAAGMILVFSALFFTPWQQSADGQGKVIAYSPTERQQNIEAPIEGRVVKWYVLEGQHVNAGSPLVDLSDNDPEVLSRLAAERDAVRMRIQAARSRVEAMDARIESLKGSKGSAVDAADSRVKMAQQRKHAAEKALAAANATAKAAMLNDERQDALFAQGLTSKRAVELAEADEVRALTEVDRASAALSAALSEIQALTSDQQKVGTDANAIISDALASKATAESEIASATAELTRIEGRLARQSTQNVRAPSDGTVLHVRARFSGEIVKSGDLLATFVPDSNELAVELFVGGNDVNLVRVGALVRLQFEGWPAVHLTGWPSAAVGTFGGRVSYVDSASADARGRFRIVIVPEAGSEWPAREHLRQGMRSMGWVLLGRVSLGYELWRRFNGFPPEWTGEDSVKEKSPDKKEGDSK